MQGPLLYSPMTKRHLQMTWNRYLKQQAKYGAVGGKKGGTTEERSARAKAAWAKRKARTSEQARKAAEARWSKHKWVI